MPRGAERSRSKRRVRVVAPGGRNILKYLPRKPSKAKCGDCKAELHGIPRVLASAMKNLPKTAKRPERPYGGNLCSRCTRKKIKATAGLSS